MIKIAGVAGRMTGRAVGCLMLFRRQMDGILKQTAAKQSETGIRRNSDAMKKDSLWKWKLCPPLRILVREKERRGNGGTLSGRPIEVLMEKVLSVNILFLIRSLQVQEIQDSCDEKKENRVQLNSESKEKRNIRQKNIAKANIKDVGFHEEGLQLS
ncbi:uncharacterized protein LOC127769648 [Oryza glaberrima]|uniref:uncharacterized protein LOC127769648 n=1 Tax=Oryza glaberrima TaxID=4538 RepID=UPI00224C14CC|nr:uncharacterized protein LOC127769648 [Oryza glaberrima]XP_052151217.1 uncharacterized protein LOC127769648 [Oryza glaberrima]